MIAKRNFTFITVLFAVLMLIVAGCSNQQSSSTSTSDESNHKETTSQEEDSEYPMTIKHAFGETVVEKKPKRVVTIQWGNQDIPLTLGVVPVGFSAANFGVQDDSGLLPWTAEKLKELGEENPNVFQDTDGLDFEAISDAKPDVILAAYSGITQEDYDTLSQIAPVVAYPEAAWTTTWRKQVEMNALGMGMEKEGKKLIKDIEEMIKEKVSHYPQIKGKKVVWVNFSAKDLSKLHIYTPIDSRAAFLYELGLVYPRSVTELIKDPNNFYLELSAENVEALYDADIIVGYGDDNLLKTIQKDPLLGKIPAVERGSIAFIESDTPLVAAGTPTPLSIRYTIDDYLELLAGAADKINE
ncbi:iron-siderophore ABC transporter substrate-binding protein [Caldifermentibacillus hisashii]|uniref:iron-siderophore ABC transporter substrate-binding protein n=1 Tax=Caldifermentibacillus hisashii TaxID=996558 RepID=UPI0031B67921